MYKLLFLLSFISTLSAELLILEHNEIEDQLSTLSMTEILSTINSSSAIVIGEQSEIPQSISSQSIAKNFDENSTYFLLLKRGGSHNRETITTYGTILFDAPSYCIFKTKESVLNEIDAFDAYEKLILQRDERQPRLYATAKRSRAEKSPLVDSIVQEVSVDSMWNMVGILQDLERYTYAQGVNSSVQFFESYLGALDFDTLFTDNYLGNGAPNIIVEKRGKTDPDEIIIIGSHYDVTKSMYPGADDNGSGSAGALEIARVISELSFHKTVRLVWFSGEEVGLLGSKDYAQKVYSAGDNITAVFNLDMIGYLFQGTALQLDVGYNNASKSLYNTFNELAQLYVPEAPVLDCKNSQWINSSDHKSFWDKGYAALYFGDDLDPNGPEHPNYHKLSDTLGVGVNSKEYLDGVTKTVAASVLTLANIWQDTEIILTEKSSLNNFTISQSSQKRYSINTNHNFAGRSTIKVVSLQGKILRENSFSGSTNLDLSGISSGKYLLIVENSLGKFERQINL